MAFSMNPKVEPSKVNFALSGHRKRYDQTGETDKVQVVKNMANEMTQHIWSFSVRMN